MRWPDTAVSSEEQRSVRETRDIGGMIEILQQRLRAALPSKYDASDEDRGEIVLVPGFVASDAYTAGYGLV